MAAPLTPARVNIFSKTVAILAFPPQFVRSPSPPNRAKPCPHTAVSLRPSPRFLLSSPTPPPRISSGTSSITLIPSPALNISRTPGSACIEARAKTRRGAQIPRQPLGGSRCCRCLQQRERSDSSKTRNIYMAVTGTTVAAAATMMAALAAIFLSFVLCFYIFLCAKRSRGAPPPPPGSGFFAHLRFLFCGGVDGRISGDSAPVWYYDGGLDEASMASLPSREVAKGEAVHCAVCITELAPGESVRVLPRCGHGFHVDCVDMWLKSHSTCPLCRCPAVDAPPMPPPPVQAPEADEEAPNFPTNVLFFGSQDDVSTGNAQPPATTIIPPAAPTPSVTAPPPAGARGIRRLLGCGGTSPPPRHQEHNDVEMGLAGGENSASRQTKPAGSS